VNELRTTQKIYWGKELWFALFFLCIGFTVWPLMVYYLGQALGFSYFVEMDLRTWAEGKVYGPLADGIWRALSRIFFLCGPYLFSFALRYALFLSRK
jgi:hypothetical protein